MSVADRPRIREGFVDTGYIAQAGESFAYTNRPWWRRHFEATSDSLRGLRPGTTSEIVICLGMFLKHIPYRYTYSASEGCPEQQMLRNNRSSFHSLEQLNVWPVLDFAPETSSNECVTHRKSITALSETIQASRARLHLPP